MRTIKDFRSVEEVCDWLNDNCTDYYKSHWKRGLKNITINGNKPCVGTGIRYGLDEICLIYIDEENNIDYIWCYCDRNNMLTYDVQRVDRNAIAELMPKYAEYIADPDEGWFDLSRWLHNEMCETKLSFDYDIIKWCVENVIE